MVDKKAEQRYLERRNRSLKILDLAKSGALKNTPIDLRRLFAKETKKYKEETNNEND